MAKKLERRVNTTVLLVVEGKTEEAFSQYIKELYSQRTSNTKVTIINARGKGPSNVLAKLQGRCNIAEYSYKFAMLDGDIPLSKTDESIVRKTRAILIVSIPAIENTLLNILGHQVRGSTVQLKRYLADRFSGDPVQRSFYEKHLPKNIIDSAIDTCEQLKTIVNLMTGVVNR